MADRKITALTSLTSPATGDLIPVVDISEAANVNKNKTLTFGQAFRSLPNGSASAPALGWLSDGGVTGLYRVAQNEIGLSVNSSFVAAITAAGFQLGAGTPAAQLHVFGSDTTDQVIIENNDTGGDTAPDVVLYRNSASPAANDNIGNIEFRGKDSGGNTAEYASVRAEIKAATDTAEDGVLDLMTSSAGTVASRVRIDGFNVGIHELDPDYPLHLTTGITSTALQVECIAVDAASGADVTLYHTRNGAASVADDKISTLFYRGKNDNASPADVDYAAIEGSVASPVDGSESGSIQLKTQTAGTLATQLQISGASLGLFGTTPAAQPAAIADLTVAATSGTLPTPDGSLTIADAAAPTNAELLEYCGEIEAKLESALAALRALGVIATGTLDLPIITYGITSAGGVFNLRSTGTVNYAVVWDSTGGYESSTLNTLPHTYAAGNYNLVIYSNDVYRPYFNNVTADVSQITYATIGSGANLGTNLAEAWYGAVNMTSFVCPFDRTSSVTSFRRSWSNCSLTSFPLIDTSSATNFGGAWRDCSLTSFPANMFDTTGTLISVAFQNAWVGCALTAQSIENILVSLDTNGASNITLGINGGTNAAKTTWTTAANTAYTNLINKGWTISFNA